MQRSPRPQFRGSFSRTPGEGFTNGLLCFSCEHIFPSKAFLEEHCCPAATHICSCGTEFPLYSDMIAHSKTHQPGHSVVDHKAVRRRRHDREQEERRRLSAQQGPSSLTSPASSLEVVSKYQVPLKSPPSHSGKISKLVRGSAALTVDLWTIYQPVVLIKIRTYKNKGIYSCGKCVQRFSTKSNLVLHYNTHARDKVFGCIGCGVLLSSSASLPQYHQCNSPSSPPAGVITTRPLCGQKPNMVPGPQTLTPSIKCKPLHVTQPKMIRLNAFPRPHSALAKKPTPAAFAINAFPCGVCYVAFDSVKLLQRHKCIEAQRIVLNKTTPKPQPSGPWRSITALKSPRPPLPPAARRKARSTAALGVASAFQHKTLLLSNGAGGPTLGDKIDLDSDDDCYIIESSTITPNKMCNLSSPLLS